VSVNNIVFAGQKKKVWQKQKKIKHFQRQTYEWEGANSRKINVNVLQIIFC
jgi:hypothetical protein